MCKIIKKKKGINLYNFYFNHLKNNYTLYEIIERNK